MTAAIPRRVPLHLSFSGCGFLIPFHLGVASYLKTPGGPLDQKPIIPRLTKDSRFAGASGGAIVATGLAGKMSIDRLMHLTLELASTCRQHGTGWKLDQVLTRALEETITPDMYETIIGCRDLKAVSEDQKQNPRLTIATTRVGPMMGQMWHYERPEIELVSDFRNREDLIQACRTSCYLPAYSAPRPLLLPFRDSRQCDGGLLNLVPQVLGYTKVCVFPEFLNQTYDISPSLVRPTYPYSMAQLAFAALRPPSEHMLVHLFELGKQSAELWELQGKQRTLTNDHW